MVELAAAKKTNSAKLLETKKEIIALKEKALSEGLTDQEKETFKLTTPEKVLKLEPLINTKMELTDIDKIEPILGSYQHSIGFYEVMKNAKNSVKGLSNTIYRFLEFLEEKVNIVIEVKKLFDSFNQNCITKAEDKQEELTKCNDLTSRLPEFFKSIGNIKKKSLLEMVNIHDNYLKKISTAKLLENYDFVPFLKVLLETK